jgi:threonine dehydrogenase-like Zn-dependent dehydrogenase
VRLHGGPDPVRRGMPELIGHGAKRHDQPRQDVRPDAPLEQVADGYRAMDERRAIKTLLMP